MTSDDPIWDELFHWCAFAAFIEEAHAAQGWPDPEKTRQLAYKVFEDTKKVDSPSEPR